MKQSQKTQKLNRLHKIDAANLKCKEIWKKACAVEHKDYTLLSTSLSDDNPHLADYQAACKELRLLTGGGKPRIRYGRK